MIEIDEGAAVAFDATAVASLTGDPADPAFAAVFVSRYRALLPDRVRRTAVAVRGEDLDDALDAVLSLKVASATVGCRHLGELAGRIEERLRAGEHGAAVAAANLLPEAARRADHALEEFLAR
jgi:HPt (histidine-containing phosphotransfer) domain-containing protein